MMCSRKRGIASPRYLAAGVLLVGMAAGCSRTPAPATAPARPSRAVRATRSELFAGDLKRLEPHLGLSSGCVRLEFRPPDRIVTLEPEVWQDGKPVPGDRSSVRSDQGPADASISLTPLPVAGGKPRYRITTALFGPGGSSAATTTRDAPGTDGVRRTYLKTLDGPIELQEGEPVAVWAYLVYEATNPFPPYSVTHGSFEEAAKDAVWAVVFKVGWTEPGYR